MPAESGLESRAGRIQPIGTTRGDDRQPARHWSFAAVVPARARGRWEQQIAATSRPPPAKARQGHEPSSGEGRRRPPSSLGGLTQQRRPSCWGGTPRAGFILPPPVLPLQQSGAKIGLATITGKKRAGGQKRYAASLGRSLHCAHRSAEERASLGANPDGQRRRRASFEDDARGGRTGGATAAPGTNSTGAADVSPDAGTLVRASVEIERTEAHDCEELLVLTVFQEPRTRAPVSGLRVRPLGPLPGEH